MKKVILFSFIVLTTIISSAQTQENAINEKNQKSFLAVKYRLYPTQNMWTFVKLNTRNGKMWQIQFDVEGNNRFETYLNILPLVAKEKEVNDRFTLYPTQNMWTFILLDQYNGKTWQVQWSIEPENRGIVPIE
jgi:uncharacterized protein YxeA